MTSLRTLHRWHAQLHAMLPGVRKTRTTGLAILVFGLLLAQTVSLPRIAAALPLTVLPASIERRLRRWLANDHVDPQPIWRTLRPALLNRYRASDMIFVFDPTPQSTTFSILHLGLLVRHRVLPLAWRLVPQQDATWPERQHTYVRAMLQELTADLPPGCTPTLLADRGVTGPEIVDACREFGWHFVLRVNARAVRGNTIRHDGCLKPLWDLLVEEGYTRCAEIDLFRKAGWRTVHLTVTWEHDAHAAWFLISDLPPGRRRVQTYRRRMRVEATHQDLKSRGMQMESSKLTDQPRFARLLLAVVLAYWWGMQLGLRTIRHGYRRQFDRPNRRDVGVWRLGVLRLHDLIQQGKSPALPFFLRDNRWSFIWLA
jgi:hypothetical protein